MLNGIVLMSFVSWWGNPGDRARFSFLGGSETPKGKQGWWRKSETHPNVKRPGRESLPGFSYLALKSYLDKIGFSAILAILLLGRSPNMWKIAICLHSANQNVSMKKSLFNL
jgi:hypothetical protein